MAHRRYRRGFRITEHRRDPDRDLDDEIAFHLEMRERELIEQGVDAASARRLAREAFGNERVIREACVRIADERSRRDRVVAFVETLGHEMGQSARSLRRRWMFTLVAVSTLALGIGANALVFSLVEAILLRAPPVQSPARLATVWTTCRSGDLRCSSSYPDFEDYRDRSTQFADMAAYTPMAKVLERSGVSEVVGVELVSANYFALLGLSAEAGRLIEPGDEGATGDRALIVLSDRYWRSRFGGDPGVIGRSVRVEGVPFVVVGVAPAGYEGLVLGQVPDAWLPLSALPLIQSDGRARLESRGSRWIAGLVARLGAGATVESARAEMRRISDQLALEDPDARGARTVTVDAMSQRVGGGFAEMSSFLWILQGTVAITLLLACANLANLLLARGTSRRGEVGVRLALGVGRGRLVLQLLMESTLLALAGGAVGLALDAIALRLVAGVSLPGGVAVGVLGAGINSEVLIFVTAVSIVTALLFGGVPALVATRVSIANVLRESRGNTAGGLRARSVLIGVQIALAIMLLVGAGLFVRTMRNRLDIDFGFDTSHLALVFVDPSMGGFPPERMAALPDRLIEAAEALPGVRSSAAATTIPLRRGGNGTFVTVDGYEPAEDEEMRIEYAIVTRGYMETLGLPLTAGVSLDSPEAIAQDNGIVVDETMARRWWSGRSAVGGTVRNGQAELRVIGVARRTAWGGLDVGNTPFVMLPATDSRLLRRQFVLVARTQGDASSLVPSLAGAVRRVEPTLAIRAVSTVDQLLAVQLGPQMTAAWLLSVFGGLALVLAAIGIYGVVTYSVARRQRDLSIRIVLGATGTRITRLVARGMMLPVACGVAAGIAGAVTLSRTVQGFMFGVTGTDPLVYVAVVVILIAVAAVATLVPARRAATANPATAIRTD